MVEPEAPENTPEPDSDQEDGDGGNDAENDASGEHEAPAFSQELAKLDNAPFGVVELGGVRLKCNAVTIQLPEKLSVQGFARVWTAVDNLRDRSKWWQGDLLNAGEARFGETYHQAMEATGSAYQSFANNASICRKYTPEQRHPNLSYSHHAIVASMPDDLREALLQRAENESLNTDQIRAEFREWKAERDAEKAGDTPPGSLDRASRPAAEPKRAEHTGILPIDPSELPDGDPGWLCPTQGCENLVFPEDIFHCLDCGAHYPAEDANGVENEACTYCAGTGETGEEEDGDVTTTPAPISGLVIPPDNGHDSSVSLSGLLEMVSIREMDVADAAEAIQSQPAALANLMALGEWITRVIEAASAESAPPVAGGKPLSPAPKPGSRKVRRTPNQAPPSEEAEGAEEEAPFL